MVEPTLLNDLVTVLVAVVGGSGGLYGVQKAQQYFRNGNGNGKHPLGWTKEAHDEICGLKFQPMTLELTHLRKEMEELHKKIDKLLA